MNKKIRRLSLAFSVVLMMSVIVGTQFVATVSAKKPIVTYYEDDEFTQIIGKLGGANYEILIPDNWNGMLVVGCRGYRHELPSPPTWPPPGSPMHQMGLYFMNASDFPVPPTQTTLFAFAFTNYGVGGFCVKNGMIRTHQLTEYVVENYDVPGKVFLLGFSMGGLIACLLGEKYPNLYDGVLDVCGPKDMIFQYEYKKAIADLPPNPVAIRAYLNGPPAYIPTSVTDAINNTRALFFRMFSMVSLADIEIACGGTPETKPKAYERWSATYHADITIPVISIIGQVDFTVVAKHFDMYYDAVEEAGRLDYYRSYNVTLGGHIDAPVVMAIPPNFFFKLVPWVVNGIAPPPTDPPIP